MENNLFNVAEAHGTWALLSVFLIFYILKAQEKRDSRQEEREEKYVKIIDSMSKELSVLPLLSKDVSELKSKINT